MNIKEMKCRSETKAKAYLENEKNKAARKENMLNRLKEKMAHDPNGIWGDLYAEMSANA